MIDILHKIKDDENANEIFKDELKINIKEFLDKLDENEELEDKVTLLAINILENGSDDVLIDRGIYADERRMRQYINHEIYWIEVSGEFIDGYFYNFEDAEKVFWKHLDE